MFDFNMLFLVFLIRFTVDKIMLTKLINLLTSDQSILVYIYLEI